MAGRKYYDANLMTSAISLDKKDVFGDESLRNLTQREREVLEALGKGYRNSDISKKLFITEYTVKKHGSSAISIALLFNATISFADADINA